MSKYYALLNDRDTLFNFLEVLLKYDIDAAEPLEEEGVVKIKNRIPVKAERCNKLIEEYIRTAKAQGVRIREHKKVDLTHLDGMNKRQLKQVLHNLDKRIFEFRKRLEKLQEV